MKCCQISFDIYYFVLCFIFNPIIYLYLFMLVSGNNSSNTDTVLEITSSNSIDANSELHLISADSKLGIVDLNFDDIVRVARFTVDGRGRAAGVWAAQAGDGVDHVDELVLQGTGRLEVLPSVTLLKIN